MAARDIRSVTLLRGISQSKRTAVSRQRTVAHKQKKIAVSRQRTVLADSSQQIAVRNKKIVIKTFKELIVWQKSMDLVVLVYDFTSGFPKEEIYGLVSQMRRCSVSIPSNIAEGWKRKNTNEFINFLSMADGSGGELETQLLLSQLLKFGNSEKCQKCLLILNEIQRMLPSMMVSLKKN